MDKKYIFDTGSDLGRNHMDCLENVLDGPTTRFLDAIGIRPGQRCLEIGAGGGSITRWLAERTGQTGTVVAVDIAAERLVEQPRGTGSGAAIEVYRHDIVEGLPVDGPFDLIHARLVLLHLPQREKVFQTLVDALAPGGWLVLGDMTDRPLRLLSAPSDSDRELWERMMHISHDLLGEARGIDLGWAYEVQDRMEQAGLMNLQSMEYSETTTGGGDGCLLHRNLNQQAEPLLLQFGATPDELARYRDLMLDPRFRAWFYQIHYTAGRRAPH